MHFGLTVLLLYAFSFGYAKIQGKKWRFLLGKSCLSFPKKTSRKACSSSVVNAPVSHQCFLNLFPLFLLPGIQMLSVQPDTKPKGCAGCNRKIKDRYLLKALDKYWHEDCLKCACCDCRLGEVGSTLYTKANLILCRRDYLR